MNTLRDLMAARTRRSAFGLVMLVVVVVVSSAGSASALSAHHRAAAASGDQPRLDTLTAPKAVVLGVVEGVTEYLPISSTGHLLIAERAMNVGQVESGRKADKDVTDTYTVVIQIGAILAVLGLYRKRFVSMIDGITGRSAEGRSLLVSLVVAFVPAAVIGFVGEKLIKDQLLGAWPVVAAWIAGGLVILAFGAYQTRLRVTVTSVGGLSLQQAAIIGLAQALALWPGTSRSLVTILAALVVGMSIQAAVEFSFLLGFVTLSAATAYEILKNGKDMVDAFGYVNPLIGIVVAGVAAWISVKWMVGYLQKHRLDVFGWYRIGAGALAAILLVTKVL